MIKPRMAHWQAEAFTDPALFVVWTGTASEDSGYMELEEILELHEQQSGQIYSVARRMHTCFGWDPTYALEHIVKAVENPGTDFYVQFVQQPLAVCA